MKQIFLRIYFWSMFSKNNVVNIGKKLLQKNWSQADIKSHLKTLNVLFQYKITQLLLDVWAIYFFIYSKVRLLMIWESADDLRSSFGRICQQSLIFFKKRNWLTGGLNPGQLRDSPVTLPLGHQDFLWKPWKLVK